MKDNETKSEDLFDENGMYIGEEDPDEEELEPAPNRRWMRVTVSLILVVVLFSQILAFWPKIYNMAAIEFVSNSRELSKNENIQQYKKAVVVINAGNSKGTGFNVAEEGLIITNDHVVDNEPYSTVTFSNGEVYRAKVMTRYPEIDIAILKIQEDDLQLPKLDIDTTSNLETGLPVYIIGNPLVFNQIANEGMYLGLTELKGWDIPIMMIQAPIYKGNSGSPVIHHDGKVVGVVFATAKMEYETKRMKVGLAIPIEYLQLP